MGNELHISSLVVQAHPSSLLMISGAIAALPGAEVHAQSELGKLVVVLDVESTAALSERMDQIQKMAGVLSASLVFHHVEEASDASRDALVLQC